MEQRIILGLDISTHCTGISIVYVNEENECSPIIVTHLRPKIPTKVKGIEALFLKCNLFMEKLGEILIDNKLYIVDKDGNKSCKVTDVVIEEPLLSSNNQITVATLLRYNGMVAQNVYNMLGIVPKFISSYDARMFGMPQLMAVRKFNKKGEMYPINKIVKCINTDDLVLYGDYAFDCQKKLIIWNYISEKYKDIQWVYDKNGNLANENFDASDSLICVLGYVNKLKYGDTFPKVVCLDQNTLDDGTKVLTYTYTFCDGYYTKSVEFRKEIEN